MSKRKEYSFSIKGSVKKGKELYEYILVALKTIIGFISVPLVLFAMLFFAMIGINLAMIKNGIHVIGPMMILIGFLITIVAALLKLLDILF